MCFESRCYLELILQNKISHQYILFVNIFNTVLQHFHKHVELIFIICEKITNLGYNTRFENFHGQMCKAMLMRYTFCQYLPLLFTPRGRRARQILFFPLPQKIHQYVLATAPIAGMAFLSRRVGIEWHRPALLIKLVQFSAVDIS
jgi:hypothetical protein